MFTDVHLKDYTPDDFNFNTFLSNHPLFSADLLLYKQMLKLWVLILQQYYI